MAEGSMSQIVSQRDGFSQILVQPQRSGNRPGDPADLQGVGHSGPVMVSFRAQEHLGFMLQPAKRFGMNDPIRISLKTSTDLAWFFRPFPSPAVGSKSRLWRENDSFQFFPFLTRIWHLHRRLPVDEWIIASRASRDYGNSLQFFIRGFFLFPF